MSPRTRLTLQIIAGLLLVGFLVVLRYFWDWLTAQFTPDFVYGFLTCGVLVLIVFYTSQWLDKSASDATRSREHQGSRRTIDL